MAAHDLKPGVVDKRKQGQRGKVKGRVVDLNALLEVQSLLGDMPRRRDLLIECLHRIQDRYGHLSAAHLTALASELRLATTEVYEVASFYHHFDVVREGETAPPPLTVRVCDSVSCELAGAEDLIAALETGLGDGVRVQRVPCVGRCDRAPVAVVRQFTVDNATAESVGAAVDAGHTEQPMPEDCIYYDAYREGGGYGLYDRLLAGEIDGDEIIDTLSGTQLRGLGGAGFPVGRKWGILRDQPAPRLCAVNIDEGEPGTFKDRYYMLSDPHRFLEGMLIAARVIGLDACYIYIRDEYPSVIAVLERCVAELREKSGYELPAIEIRRGAGAYICGEESAMIESIEGKRGMPRLRPPYVAQVGLFGRPTLEHNCESLFWIRDVVEKGSECPGGSTSPACISRPPASRSAS